MHAEKRPPLPGSLQNLVIDGPWACTTDDNPEQFLFSDNGQDADCRIVAFASKPAMRLLAGADTWFVISGADLGIL